MTLLDAIESNKSDSSPADTLRTVVALERKTEKGHYQYITPKHFDADTARMYEEAMDSIYAAYSSVLRELVGFVRKQHLKKDGESNAEWKARTTLRAASVAGALLPVASVVEGEVESTSQATQPDALLDLVDKAVPMTLSPAADHLTLHSYAPRNELDLVSEMLFELSSQSGDAIEESVDELVYEDKIGIFRAYLSNGNTSALSQAIYTWEAVDSMLTLRQLQSLEPRVISVQEFTPRHGYDVPQLVEDAGMSDLFERAFDTAYELYSKLQANGYSQEARLATLLGHRVRARIETDALFMRELGRDKDVSGNNLSKKMLDLQFDAHPSLTEQS